MYTMNSRMSGVLALAGLAAMAASLGGCGDDSASGDAQAHANPHGNLTDPMEVAMNEQGRVAGEPGSLRAELEARYANYLQTADDERKRVYAEGIAAVAESGVLERAKKTGDTAPNFALPDKDGETVELSLLLADGPVVLLWYRGGWCPYCNLTLRAYQQRLAEINGLGATLVAVSPELPDQTAATIEKDELGFVVLSDAGNAVAHDYGVVFSLTPEVHTIYNEAFGFDAHNGQDSGELPLAATYVIDRTGTIRYAFLDPDYTKRAEPDEVIAALERLASP